MYKASFHAVWPTVAVQHMRDIPAILRRCGVLQHVDVRVYTGSRRLFRTVGSRKTASESHFLKPMRNLHPTYSHFIQNTAMASFTIKSEANLTPMTDITNGNDRPAARLAAHATPTAKAEWLADHDQTDLQHTVKELLTKKGILPSTYSMRNIRGCDIYCSTSSNSGRKCITGKGHDRNNFIVDLRRSGHVYYRCLSKNCTARHPHAIGMWHTDLLADLDSKLQPNTNEPNVHLLRELHDYYEAEAQRIKQKPEAVPGFATTELAVVKYLNHYWAFMSASDEFIMFKLDAAGDYLSYTMCGKTPANHTAPYAFWFARWRSHANRQQLYSTISDPTQPHIVNGSFNRGANLMPRYHADRLEVTEADIAIIQPLLDHMRDIMCAGNEEYFHNFLQWQALAARFPDKKTKVAMLFKGTQGCGKGLILGQLFKSIWQGTYVQVDDLDKNTSNFMSTIVADKTIVFGDEW
jgi:hypothetical protein